MNLDRRKKLIAALVAVVVLVLIAIAIIFISINSKSENFAKGGAIVSNGKPCPEIGMKIMRKYGNAIDALIATMLCDGVTTMNNMGIGGGFIATIYKRDEKKAYSLMARETAPAASTPTMFDHNRTFSMGGGKSVAVPGELMGYWEMYNKFGGSAPWKELFQPTIDLCRNGVPINKHVATNIKNNANIIKQTSGLSQLLLNDKGELPVESDTIKMLKLADTLEQVANNGINVIYNGTLSQPLINDITEHGGIMTIEDLASYRVRWEEPVTINLNHGLTMFSVPAPGSGPILGFMLKVLDGLIPTSSKELDVSMITETFKFAYAYRSQFGDPHYVNMTNVLNKLKDPATIENARSKLKVNKTSTNPKDYGADYFVEDHGTDNIVVLGPNGDAVAATSTINLIFGSKLVSKSTGIILNDEMDDFSSPGIVNYFGVAPSTSNFIKPGARPVSSMCPSIFINENGDVRLAIGGAGGTRITSSTAEVAIGNLWNGENIAQAVAMPRYHHQLFPMVWYYESTVPQNIIDYMKNLGHNVTKQDNIQSCVTAISQIGQSIMASDDKRRPGNKAYLEQVKID